MPNVYELRRVQKHIHAFPEEWNQEYFFFRKGPECGTASCVAGWAVQLHGWTPIRFVPHSYDVGFVALMVQDGQGNEEAANSLAQEILGLTALQADRLFDPGNSLEDIDRFIDELCGGEW